MRRSREIQPTIPPAAHNVGGGPGWAAIRRAFLGLHPMCQVCGEGRAELVKHFPRTREQLISDGISRPDAPPHLRGICAFCYFTS